jgi:hypothetical protein
MYCDEKLLQFPRIKASIDPKHVLRQICYDVSLLSPWVLCSDPFQPLPTDMTIIDGDADMRRPEAHYQLPRAGRLYRCVTERLPTEENRPEETRTLKMDALFYDGRRTAIHLSAH